MLTVSIYLQSEGFNDKTGIDNPFCSVMRAEKYDDTTEVPREFIEKLRSDPAKLQQELLDELS
jgi:hypothetical protein